MWVKTSTAVRLTSLSRMSFRRHLGPWQPKRPDRCIRSKLLQLEEENEPMTRLYLPDVLTFAGLTSLRQSLNFVPIFCGHEIRVMDGDEDTHEVKDNGAPRLIRIEMAASYLDVCRETISKRLIYCVEPVPFRIRATRSEAKAGRNNIPLCYWEDVNALLSDQDSVTATRKTNRYHA